jgi:hypothetical protein
MNKKAVQLVTAFLLFDGAFKRGNNDTNAKVVHNYLFGEMKASAMLKCSFGSKSG